MKRILIAGAGSYVGNAIEKCLLNFTTQYKVKTLDMKDPLWINFDFTGYDVLIHLAGIVHIKIKKKDKNIYYKVNRDLAIAVANKAKKENVGHFILFSTMNVYGITATDSNITKETLAAPQSDYGKSKAEADCIIQALADSNFKVAILRPPMIYGFGCKGNYSNLSNLAKKCCFFPSIYNERSMIYIENLVYFTKDIIDKEKYGLFFPQNQEYVCTTEMVYLIAKNNGNKVVLVKTFNWLIKKIKLNLTNKIFGNLRYEKVDLCNYINFENSIYFSEKKHKHIK